jgi:hypothetical protein
VEISGIRNPLPRGAVGILLLVPLSKQLNLKVYYRQYISEKIMDRGKSYSSSTLVRSAARWDYKKTRSPQSWTSHKASVPLCNLKKSKTATLIKTGQR